MLTLRILPMDLGLRMARSISALVMLVAGLAAGPSFARDVSFANLVVKHMRIHAVTGAPDQMVGLLAVRNNGFDKDTLIRASVEKSVAQKVEIQRFVFRDGFRQAVAVPGIGVEPGEMVEMKPGRIQLAFIGLTKPLKAGSTVEVELVFRKAGGIIVEFEVDEAPVPMPAPARNDPGEVKI